ncbi:hypothetical protein KJ564_02280, partial [bacterium]|nr:hypothetical protein [bacterium]
MLAPDKQNVWLETCRRFAASIKADLWQAPLWILPDTRHKSAAERDSFALTDVGAIPTNNIVTLLQFAGQLLDLAPVEVTISPAEAILLLQQVLAKETPTAYKGSFGTPGFLESLWQALEEAEARGFFPAATLPTAEAPEPSKDLRSIQSRLHAELSRSGRYTAGQLLFEARSKLLKEPFVDRSIAEILIGPFFEFTPLEKAFIQTLKKQSKVTLTWIEPSSAIDQMSDGTRQLFAVSPITPEE